MNLSRSPAAFLAVLSVILLPAIAVDPPAAPPVGDKSKNADSSAEAKDNAGDSKEVGTKTRFRRISPGVVSVALVESLYEEISELKGEILELRTQLAEADLRAAEADRELEEIRQFIADNREYGEDFAQYRQIKEITEKAERRRAVEEARRRRQEEVQRRREVRDGGGQEASPQEIAEAKREAYIEAGFEPLGLEVYLGRTGFFYGVERRVGAVVEFSPVIGDFLEPIGHERIDFSKMTISGTVLNGSEEMRNLGIAVAFFDERGNQVGSETIQVNNARPNVPYPFTSILEMALDRPFARSTAWVLYADPTEPPKP